MGDIMQKLKKSKELNKIEPLNNYIAVSLLEETTETNSKFVISDTAKEKPNHGTVVAVSSELKNCNINVGDIVYFPAYLVVETVIDSKKLAMVKYEDVACKIK